jgi:dipeptidyl aminopeptidase/acylaminoacyl peptidase
MADAMHQKYFVLAVVCLSPIPGAIAAQRPIGAADTLAIKNISEVAPSPDGRTIMFTLGTIDLAANKTLDQLMRIPVGGGDPEPVKGAPEDPNSVRWSSGGSRIAFIARSDKGNAIYTLEVASGKLTRVCDYRRSNGFDRVAPK